LSLASFRVGKTKSGLPNTGWWRRQPVMRWARKIAMRRSSVAALPRERIADIIAERFDSVAMPDSGGQPGRSNGRGKTQNLRPAHRRPACALMNERILTDAGICGGKPVIRGMRIMVRNILGLVAGGYTVERILQTYSELTREDGSAALEYAAQLVGGEQIFTPA